MGGMAAAGSADAALPFGRFARLWRHKIVEAAAGVRLDVAERCWFHLEVEESARQDDVFENVGEIARVKLVAIIHFEELDCRRQTHNTGGTEISRAWQPCRATSGQA